MRTSLCLDRHNGKMLETKLPPLALAWLDGEYLKKNSNLAELDAFAAKLERIVVTEWATKLPYAHDVVLMAARSRLKVKGAPLEPMPLPAEDANSPEVLDMNELAGLVGGGIFLRRSLSYYLYGAGLPWFERMPTELLPDECAGKETLERIIQRYSLECKFKTHNDLYVPYLKHRVDMLSQSSLLFLLFLGTYGLW